MPDENKVPSYDPNRLINEATLAGVLKIVFRELLNFRVQMLAIKMVVETNWPDVWERVETVHAKLLADEHIQKCFADMDTLDVPDAIDILKNFEGPIQ